MDKKRIDDICDKIANYIITKYPQEICNDMNDILHTYLRDILQNLILKYGNNITDEKIYLEVDNFINGMYADNPDNGSVEIDLPELEMIKEKEYLQMDTTNISHNLKDIIDESEDDETAYDIICNNLHDAIYKAKMSEEDRSNIEMPVIQMLSYCSYNGLLANALINYLMDNKDKLQMTEEEINDHITTEMNNIIKEMTSGEKDNQDIKKKTNKIIDFSEWGE